jgi:hypothetical protein
MAIKFSQLPKIGSLSSNVLLPVVTIGTSSNVLGVATYSVFSDFVNLVTSNTITNLQSNISSLQSNAAAQDTSINSLSSSISGQTTTINIHTGQITSLQANSVSLAANIANVSSTVLGGVVNSITVTTPLAKTGNATYPNLSIGVATTSTSGYLTSTDWNTFNNKAPTAEPTFTGITTVATLATGNVAPSANATANIGSTSLYYNNVFGINFYGKSVSSQYADLAEMYLPDAEYPVGTVVMIGGEAEITACQPNSRAIGAISANPAYRMNSDLENGVFVALKGRVPVFVAGPVRKGQDLVADTCGCAIANSIPAGGTVFAVALATNEDTSIKLVEALIL